MGYRLGCSSDSIINKIKAAWPQARLVVLVEDELEFQAAQTAGGDVLLRKGFPAAKFIEAVEKQTK